MTVALPTMPISDYLTRKLLRKITGTGTPLTALLEQLVTDSVYKLKDDFDKGLDANVWNVVNMQIGDDELNSDQPEDDEEGNAQGFAVSSVSDRWELGKRPVMMAKVNFGPTTNLAHFEFGFVAMPTSEKVVTDVAQRNNSVGSFALAVRDANFASPSQFYVSSGGVLTTMSSVATTPTPPLQGEMTLMVAANEQGETRLWVNGQHDNSFSGDSAIAPAFPCHLRVMGVSGSLSIDYIQAWRERTLL